MRFLATVLALAALQEKPAHLPLGKTSKWTYQTGYDVDMIYVVTGTEKVGDVECFVVDHRMNDRTIRKEWLAVDKEGVRVHKTSRGKSELSVEKPFFKMKSELKKDDTWTGEAKGSSDLVVKYEYAVEDEVDVEVPAGKFKAWKIRVKIDSGTQSSVEGYEWYAKDVGMVKLEWALKVGGETNDVTYELKEHKK